MGELSFRSVIFDLDGVITKTALVHAKAWKEAFDEYLRLRQKRDGEPFVEFTHDNDYLPYVDGKPRYDGVKSFLESRNIHIPYGTPQDAPDQETICGIGNRKNDKFREVVKRDGAEVYESTIALIKELKKAGIKIGVASSSKNCKYILEASGIEDFFETRVDGVVSAELGLKGKPEPDIFVKATTNLGVPPVESIVVEDATSGVAAGRNGGFGLVLGVARKGNTNDLFTYGGDIVLTDLAEITIGEIDEWFKRMPPSLFDVWESIPSGVSGKSINPTYLRAGKTSLLSGKSPVFFLDYDGTLTPIVERPELAVISEEMRNTIKELSQKCTVAIVSGRMREDVENLARVEGIFYAGSHGFDIRGLNFSYVLPEAEKLIPLIAEIIEELKEKVGTINGAIIEEKKFSVAVHYRLSDPQEVPGIQKIVEEIVGRNHSLRLMHGKKVFEILPAIPWNKGRAVRWIMQALKLSWEDSNVIYIGDDTTDEDAFRVVRTRGAGILVAAQAKISSADYRLNSPDEVKKLFDELIQSL